MTLDARPAIPPTVQEMQAAARRQARALSGGVVAVVGSLTALVAVAAYVILDYRFNQYPHRLFKMTLGAAVVVLIMMRPHLGLFLFPVATPVLGLMPKLPLPGMNTVNLMLFSVFFAWAATRAVAGQALFRSTRLGGIIGVFLGLAALSIVRGAAIPTGYAYNPGFAYLQLWRAVTAIAPYFICLFMAQGERDRRVLGWGLALGLVAEAAYTAFLGPRDYSGRAKGTMGQSNEVGAYLAMFTAFATAMIVGVRRWFLRALMLVIVAIGSFGVLSTVSRGALIALGAALLYATARSSRLLTAVVLATLMTSPLWIPENVKDRVLGTQVEVEGTDEKALEGSAQIRLDTWQATMKVVSEHFLDGVGFAGLRYVLPEAGGELGRKVMDSSHNAYLRILAEMGILGLLLFLLLLWRIGKLAMDGARVAKNRFERQLGVGLGAALIALVISCWFGDRFWSIDVMGNFWILCALVNGAVMEPGERRT